jgi:hypothetical protein
MVVPYSSIAELSLGTLANTAASVRMTFQLDRSEKVTYLEIKVADFFQANSRVGTFSLLH